MNTKNDFGKTQHQTPAPFLWDYPYFVSEFTLLEEKLKTGLDKITRDKYRSILTSEYKIIKRKFENKSYHFSRFKEVKTKNGRIVYIPTIRDRLVIQYLKTQMEKYHKPIYPNRENISKLLISKLSFGQEFYIFRYDIRSFFESIPHQILLKKIKENNYLSSHDYSLVKSFITSNRKIGLPTGLSINNILAEIFLEDIDFQIKKVDSKISLYCRYVDDIIIMINGNLKEIEKDKLDRAISDAFKINGLKLNTDEAKKQIVHVNNKENAQFNFLGYEYILDKGNLKIDITTNKKRILIDKINFIFDSYCQDKNFELLIERLSYITRINTMVKLRKTKKGKFRPFLIRYGLLENYKNVDPSFWEMYDKIIAARIHSDLRIELVERKNRRQLFKNQFLKNILNKKKNNFHKFSNNDFIVRILRIKRSYSRQSLSKYNRNKLEVMYKEILCL